MHMTFTGERFVPHLQGQMYYEHLHRYAVSLPLARGKDVLDIASGEGYGAAFLAMTARSVVGVDIDQVSVSHAAARYPAMNLSFRVGSATQIPLADASIDVITSFETIEHLAEHEQMLSEMQRVLRPHGHLVISSPNRLVYSDERNYANPFHVRELYFNEFRDLLRTFFPEVHIYGQRIFGACAIHPIDGSQDETRWIGPSLSREAGMPGLPNPEYFVAVCCRKAGTKLPNLSTVYLDLRDDLLVDVRSGGLTATGPVNLMLERAAGSPVEPLAITSGRGAAQDLSAECDRLTKQCQELEHELRASRRREAESRLEVQNLAPLPGEVAALRQQVNELERGRTAEFERAESWRLEAQTKEASFDLLLARLSGLQTALDEALLQAERARSELSALKGSRSWRVTAALRQAGSVLHKPRSA